VEVQPITRTVRKATRAVRSRAKGRWFAIAAAGLLLSAIAPVG
jgi:hypothetical protein